MKTIIYFIALLSFIQVSAQQNAPSPNAVEADVLWPFVSKTIRVHYTRTLWTNESMRGDLILGLNADLPRDRDTEGNFADYSIVTGYRQYLWKGLHLEFNQTTGLGVLKDHVTTGETYNSFDWLMSGYVGYQCNLGKVKKWYILPQFGIAGVVYKSNPWPIYEDETLQKEVGEEPFMLGSLRVGFRF
ncbi:MAG: hypothetical protein ACK5DD_07060 [Cyclobacteriaceae bacterium]|jgi:hypothetical protein